LSHANGCGIKGQYGAGAEVTDFSEYHLFFSKDLDGLPELGHLILSSALSVSSIAPFWLVSPRKSVQNQGTDPYLNGTEPPKKNITTAKIWRLKAARAR
jgi:hypothetical protein